MQPSPARWARYVTSEGEKKMIDFHCIDFKCVRMFYFKKTDLMSRHTESKSPMSFWPAKETRGEKIQSHFKVQVYNYTWFRTSKHSLHIMCHHCHAEVKYVTLPVVSFTAHYRDWLMRTLSHIKMFTTVGSSPCLRHGWCHLPSDSAHPHWRPRRGTRLCSIL